MKKMTKKDYFNQLLGLDSVKGNKALVDFINHELELLSSKKSSHKMTPAQKENEKTKVAILEYLSTGEYRSSTEVAKALSLSSNQKATALLKQLIDDDKVLRIVDKKGTLFKIKA